MCGVEGHTQYGKPVFNCTLNIAWRGDLLLTPTINEVTPDADEQQSGFAAVIGAMREKLPAGRARMAAKFVASRAPKLVPQVMLLSMRGAVRRTCGSGTHIAACSSGWSTTAVYSR